MPIPAGSDDFIPTTIVNNLRYPPPATIAFWGYLGKALKRPPAGTSIPAADANVLEPAVATEIYWRLYRTLTLDEYIEFRDADVVCYLTLASATIPLNGSLVWLKQGAKIQHIRVNSIELQTSFLQGPIAGGGILPDAIAGSAGLANVSWGCGSYACGSGPTVPGSGC